MGTGSEAPGGGVWEPEPEEDIVLYLGFTQDVRSNADKHEVVR